MKRVTPFVRLFLKILFFCLLFTVSAGFIVTMFFGIRHEAIVYVNPMLGFVEFALLSCAWICSARKKKLILFLRHFNDREANQLLTRAMYGSLKTNGRLVVLDDNDFRPVYMPWKERVFSAVLSALLLVGLSVIVLLGLTASGPVQLDATGQFFRQSGFVSVLAPESSGIPEIAISSTANTSKVQLFVINGIPTMSKANYGTFSVIPVPDILFDKAFSENRRRLVLSLPDSIPLYGLFMLLLFFLHRVLLNSKEIKTEIRTPADIEPILRHIRRFRWKLLSPRLLGVLATVLKVKGECWQDVVTRSASIADMIVIDCSIPTESIIWELALCKQHFAGKTIVTMDKDDIIAQRQNGTEKRQRLMLTIEEYVASTSEFNILKYDSSTLLEPVFFQKELEKLIHSA